MSGRYLFIVTTRINMPIVQPNSITSRSNLQDHRNSTDPLDSEFQFTYRTSLLDGMPVVKMRKFQNLSFPSRKPENPAMLSSPKLSIAMAAEPVTLVYRRAVKKDRNSLKLPSP